MTEDVKKTEGHTPTPWRLEITEPYGQGDWHGWAIVAEHGTIAHISAASQRGPIDIESNRDNARLIVTAVNERSALLKCEDALRAVARGASKVFDTNPTTMSFNEAQSIARAALTLLDEARK